MADKNFKIKHGLHVTGSITSSGDVVAFGTLSASKFSRNLSLQISNSFYSINESPTFNDITIEGGDITTTNAPTDLTIKAAETKAFRIQEQGNSTPYLTFDTNNQHIIFGESEDPSENNHVIPNDLDNIPTFAINDGALYISSSLEAGAIDVAGSFKNNLGMQGVVYARDTSNNAHKVWTFGGNTNISFNDLWLSSSKLSTTDIHMLSGSSIYVASNNQILPHALQGTKIFTIVAQTSSFHRPVSGAQFIGSFSGDGSKLTDLPTSVGGVNRQVQYNQNGVIDGNNGFIFVTESLQLHVFGGIYSSGSININNTKNSGSSATNNIIRVTEPTHSIAGALYNQHRFQLTQQPSQQPLVAERNAVKFVLTGDTKIPTNMLELRPDTSASERQVITYPTLVADTNISMSNYQWNTLHMSRSRVIVAGPTTFASYLKKKDWSFFSHSAVDTQTSDDYILKLSGSGHAYFANNIEVGGTGSFGSKLKVGDGDGDALRLSGSVRFIRGTSMSFYGVGSAKLLTLSGNYVTASNFKAANSMSMQHLIVGNGNFTSASLASATQDVISLGDNVNFGNITASGDISASGKIYAYRFDTEQVNAGLIGIDANASSTMGIAVYDNNVYYSGRAAILFESMSNNENHTIEFKNSNKTWLQVQTNTASFGNQFNEVVFNPLYNSFAHFKVNAGGLSKPTSSIFVTSSGYVGIGITDSSSLDKALVVQGDISASNITASTINIGGGSFTSASLATGGGGGNVSLGDNVNFGYITASGNISSGQYVYASELVGTTAITLNGDRRTSWPSPGGGGTGIFSQTSSYYSTINDVVVTGSLGITGTTNMSKGLSNGTPLYNRGKLNVITNPYQVALAIGHTRETMEAPFNQRPANIFEVWSANRIVARINTFGDLTANNGVPRPLANERNGIIEVWNKQYIDTSSIDPGEMPSGSSFATFWNVRSGSDNGVVSESAFHFTWNESQPLMAIGNVIPSASLSISGSLTGSMTDLIRVQNDIGVPVLKVKPDKLILRNSGSSLYETTMSVDSNSNLIINDTMKINHNEVIFKSGSQEVKTSVNSSTGQLKFEKSDGTYIAMKGADIETKDSSGVIKTRIYEDGKEIIRSGSATSNQIEIVQNPNGAVINASGSNVNFNLINTSGKYKQIFANSTRLINDNTNSWSYGFNNNEDFVINPTISPSNSSKFMISQSGFVTIDGDISASGKYYAGGPQIGADKTLEVEGSISASGDIFIGGSSPRVYLGDKVGSWGGFQSIGHGVYFYSDGTNAPLFLTGSNVSIGSTNPTKKLTVEGDISASGDMWLGSGAVTKIKGYNTNLQFEIDDNVALSLIETGGANDYSIFNQTGKDIDFYVATTGSNYTLAVDGESDRVAIGATPPSIDAGFSQDGAKFSVLGNITTAGSNGHITASGDISASGNISANQLQSITRLTFDTEEYIDSVTGGIFTSGHITASGNISTSADLISNDLFIDSTITHNGDTDTKLIFADNALRFTLGDVINTNFYSYGTRFELPITASGEISASGYIYGDRFYSNNRVAAYSPSADKLRIGYDSSLDFVEYGKDLVTNHKFYGHITASGNISSSGMITTNGITVNGTQLTSRIDHVDNSKAGVTFGDGIFASGGHITASNNISASGDIYGNEINGTAIYVGDSNIRLRQLDSDLEVNYPFKVNSPGGLFAQQITSSGNISASDYIYANIFQATTAIVPDSDGGAYLGTVAKRFSMLNTDGIKVEGDVSASGDLLLGDDIHLNLGSGAIRWGVGTEKETKLWTGTSGTINFQSGSTHLLQMSGSAGGALVGIGGAGLTSGKTLTVAGDISGSGNLDIDGTITATRKSFVIPHPTDKDKKLQYASLEGPENGVYIRGKLKGGDRIYLPHYWSELIDESTISVSLTPIGRFQYLYVKDISSKEIMVGIDKSVKRRIYCHYVVYAERKDIDKLEVEI